MKLHHLQRSKGVIKLHTATEFYFIILSLSAFHFIFVFLWLSSSGNFYSSILRFLTSTALLFSSNDVERNRQTLGRNVFSRGVIRWKHWSGIPELLPGTMLIIKSKSNTINMTPISIQTRNFLFLNERICCNCCIK